MNISSERHLNQAENAVAGNVVDRHDHVATTPSSLSWAEQAVADACREGYKTVRAHMPVPEAYKDDAVAGLAAAGTIVVAAAVARPALARMLTTETALAARAEGVHMVPLTEANLNRAIAAGKDGFGYGGPFLNPARDFKASLDPMLNAQRLSLDPKIEANARYWLAVDKDGEVLGTTGLYETGKDQSEAAWMGWMSVRSAYRGQGIGQKLVQFSIDQAKADGKDYLRLYTSNAKGEMAAQSLYENNGLQIVGSEPHTIPRIVQRIFGQKEPLRILFRELDLNAVK